VALTGYGQPPDRRRALEVGFNAYLVKPVYRADLARVLAGAPVEG
jgi:CheY-like chemotaxis protein